MALFQKNSVRVAQNNLNPGAFTKEIVNDIRQA